MTRLLPPIQHVVALVPNWIGDAAMCTPALRLLRKRFPNACLTVGGRAGVVALLKDLPGVDRFVTLPGRSGFKAMHTASRELAATPVDLAVVFPHSFRAALLARMTGARRILGYDRGHRHWILTDRVPPYREAGKITPVYMAHEYLDLLKPLGVEDDGEGLQLGVNNTVRREVQTQLAGDGPLVALAPGAAFGESKRWPAERFAGVADALADQAGARCVLVTGPGEEATRDAVRAAARTTLLCGDDDAPTLDTLKATLATADLLVGNDSGPRHIAIAFRKPVICIMGPTSPRYTDSPWERGRVLRVDVDCGPCQKPTCATDHRCMTGISVEAVTRAAREFLP